MIFILGLDKVSLNLDMVLSISFEILATDIGLFLLLWLLAELFRAIILVTLLVFKFVGFPLLEGDVIRGFFNNCYDICIWDLS